MAKMINIQQEANIEAETGSHRAYPGLEWTESEWFKVWLELARDEAQHEHN